MKHPVITDEGLFIAKIFEALLTATDFQPGEGTYMYKDKFVVIPDATGRYKCKVEFFEDVTTPWKEDAKIKIKSTSWSVKAKEG